MSIILGEKVNMSQMYDEGDLIAVTLIKVKDCKVKRLLEKSENRGVVVLEANSEIKGKKNIEKGFSVPVLSEYKEGQEFKTPDFKSGDKVDVFGVSKGKGFQGVVKRYNFGGDLKTHGRAHSLRKGGSIASKRLSKVAKGRKMPGRTGGKRNCIYNMKLVKVDEKLGVIVVKGAIPGRKGSLIEIRTK